MNASQTAIAVAGHNVANAATEGYSRQRVDLAAATPQITPSGVIGSGVTVADIARVHDSLLDVGFRQETASNSFYQTRAGLLGQVQGLHGDLSTPGLSDSLNAFWNAWSDLSNDPASSTARGVVKQTAQQLVDSLHRMSTGLDRIAAGGAQQLTQDVSQLNKLSSTIASLNTRIVAEEAGGRTAGDLRDARDVAIDQISKLADVQVLERSDHTVAVNIQGINVVDGPTSIPLQVDSTGGVYSLKNANGLTVGAAGGSLGATIGVLNNDLPQGHADLDALARNLAIAVNGVHTQGMNAAGQTNVLFFDDQGNPATITAASLSLSAAVAADPQAIAAGTPGTDPITGNPVYALARNDTALSLAALRDAPIAAFGNHSIGEAYSQQVAQLGTAVQDAQDNTEVHASLASRADTQRMSVSGVNIDEEMVNLMRFQNAYAAAARVITTADEMFQSLLDMKR